MPGTSFGMTVPTTFNELTNLVGDEFRKMPREAIAAIISLSAAIEVFIFVVRLNGGGRDPVVLGLGLILMIGALAVSYLTSMRLIDAPKSLRGFGAYLGTTALTALPATAGFALILAGRYFDNGYFTFAGIMLLLASLAITPLLYPWPLLQAVSPRFIGPREAFRRSAGMRGALLLTAIIFGVIARTDFRPDSTELTLMSVGAITVSLVVNVLSTLFAISVSVAAFKRMN